MFVKNFGEAASQLMCEKSMLEKFDFTPCIFVFVFVFVFVFQVSMNVRGKYLKEVGFHITSSRL